MKKCKRKWARGDTCPGMKGQAEQSITDPIDRETSCSCEDCLTLINYLKRANELLYLENTVFPYL